MGGEIDLMVVGTHVASPATIEWMSSYQSAVLQRFGYSATRGCGKARLCPAFSLPDLFQRRRRERRRAGHPSRLPRCSGLLSVIPPYFSQDVITPRPAHGDARLRDPPDEPRRSSSS